MTTTAVLIALAAVFSALAAVLLTKGSKEERQRNGANLRTPEPSRRTKNAHEIIDEKD